MRPKRQRIQKLSPVEQNLLAEAQRLLDAGRHAAASEHCDQLARAKPRAPEPWRLKSWIHMCVGDFFVAQAAAEQAAQLQPSNPVTVAWAAEVCSEAGDLRAAHQYRQQVLRLGSQEPAVLSSLAASLTAEESHGQALDYYRRLLKNAPGDLQAQLNVAYSARFAGEFELAELRLRDIMATHPTFYQAHFALSQLRTVTVDDNHLALLESALKTCASDPEGGAFLGYALGKEYEDIGEYPRAFEHYDRGAYCQRQLHRQPSREAEMARRLGTLFGRLPPPVAGARGAGLIFVIGLPRTGTTLLDRMLGAHSRVRNGGELRAFPFAPHRQLGMKMGDVISPALLDQLDRLDYDKLGEAYLHCLPREWLAGGYITDKNPVNYLYAGMIARALPGAKILHIRRNPMDACFASYKQLFAPNAYRHSYRMEDLAQHYAAYSGLLGQWRDTLGDSYIELSYEDLVADSEGQLRRVLAACGPGWEDSVMDFHRRGAGVGTASFAQVRQPVYTASVDKWRRFEPQLQPLARALAEAGIVQA